MPIIESIPNVSEGRRPEVIERLMIMVVGDSIAAGDLTFLDLTGAVRVDPAAPAAPTSRASATHSAIVTSSIGTNGTTSTAPSRGCSP